MKPSQVRYALVCNEEGGILDDVLVYGGTPDGGRPYSMVVNASNREKIVAFLNQHKPSDEISIADDTLGSAMIAVQGPRAVDVLAPLVEMTASSTVSDPS